jgi:16S rRNA (uracil1498-N3)-methyltransferase
MSLKVERKTRDPESIPDLWLAFAPVKRAQTDWLVEKATELGVARLIPVITQRTIVERVKLDRLESIALEAAEQCGRTRLPEIDEPVSLTQFLERRNKQRTLYFADEQGGEKAANALKPGPAAILTGPEGGFTDDERDAIRSARNVTAISLGPRILRAETAALASVTIYMALGGDWR